MVLETPSPVVNDALSTAAVAIIIICSLLLITLFSFLYYCVPLYIFYTEKPRRQFLYTYSKEDTQFCTVMCTMVSKNTISCCFPSLRHDVEHVDIYMTNVNNLNVTETGRTHPLKSIFAFKKNSIDGTHRLQTDEEACSLLPVRYHSTMC